MRRAGGEGPPASGVGGEIDESIPRHGRMRDADRDRGHVHASAATRHGAAAHRCSSCDARESALEWAAKLARVPADRCSQRRVDARCRDDGCQLRPRLSSACDDEHGEAGPGEKVTEIALRCRRRGAPSRTPRGASGSSSGRARGSASSARRRDRAVALRRARRVARPRPSIGGAEPRSPGTGRHVGLSTVPVAGVPPRRDCVTAVPEESCRIVAGADDRLVARRLLTRVAAGRAARARARTARRSRPRRPGSAGRGRAAPRRRADPRRARSRGRARGRGAARRRCRSTAPA